MRAVVTNCVALNGGDAAILLGLARTLELAFGECTIDVFDKQAVTAARLYPDLSFHPWLWDSFEGPFAAWRRRRAPGALLRGRPPKQLREPLGRFREADVVLGTGGTYLVERYDLAPRLLELEAPLALGVPLVLFTQSMGPFRTPSLRRRLSRILDEARLVLLRDERSRDHVRELGVENDRVHVVADAAFTLVDEPAVEARRRDPGMRTGHVAVSARDLSSLGSVGSDAVRGYRAALARCVETLVGCEYRVTFLSTCQGVPEYWLDDSIEAMEVVRLLPPRVRSAVTVERGFSAPESLRDRFGSFDLVIATRMHAAILALAGGTPVLPLAYEFKTKELFERLGTGELVQDALSLDPGSLGAALETFLTERGRVTATQMGGTLRERRSALEAATLLRGALEQRA